MSAFGNSGNNMYGGGGSSMNNMMPMLMLMQNGQGNNKIDPEILKVMMSDMMMSGMSVCTKIIKMIKNIIMSES